VEAEELMKAFADAWTRADRDAFLALMHAEAEMYLPRSVLEGGPPYRGLEGAAQAFADGFDIWERFEVELREVSYVGDLLVAAYRSRQVPRGHGPAAEYDAYSVTELRDGKIVYWRPYLDRAEALQAAEARLGGRLQPG
jgi:ketosteroid isomerase-like protein